MMLVVVNPAAKADILEITGYSEAEAGSFVARRYAERFRAVLSELAVSAHRCAASKAWTLYPADRDRALSSFL